jgi:hypothetical protein
MRPDWKEAMRILAVGLTIGVVIGVRVQRAIRDSIEPCMAACASRDAMTLANGLCVCPVGSVWEVRASDGGRP